MIDLPVITESAAPASPDLGSPAAASDEALMVALAGGDDLALNRLMDRWQVPLRRFLFRYTQNRQDAYDLAQDTFVRVYQHRSRFQPGRRFSTWMFQIALNLARSRMRWRLRHPTDALEQMPELPDDGGDLATTDSPASQTLAAERVAVVRSAIAGLPRELREALLLFEYEGRSYGEIAIIVCATAKAVETRLARARRQLRAVLGRFLS